MSRSEPFSPFSDEELVVQARAGSSPAMDELWRRYQRRLFLFVRRRVANDQDAEDILQETFIKAMRYLDHFDERYRFASWIYSMCNQLIISHYRRRRNDSLPEDLVAGGNGPAEAAEGDSLKERLWQAAAALPQKQFDAVWLRYVEEMSVAEVAKSLSISGICARVLLHRARLALVQKFAADRDLGLGASDNMIGVTP